MYQLQQPQLEMEALFLLVAQVAVGTQHDLHKAREIFFAKAFGHSRHAGALVGGNLQHQRIAARHLGDHCIAQEAQHLAREVLRALAFHQQAIHHAQHVFAGVTRDGVHHIFQHLRRHRADQAAHNLRAQGCATGGDGLVHDAKRVAHGAVTRFGQHGERVVVGLDSLLPGDAAQLGNDVVEAHGVKAEVLAARADGLRDVLGLRCRHHEDDVTWRLLQRLQQRIEGGVGDLVRLVEDVNLETVARRTIARGLAQFANFVNAAVGGGVNLDYVHRVASANLKAGIAHAAGFGHGMVLRPAIQRHGQDARDGGFADAPMAAEDIAVRNPLLLDGVLQGTSDVLLPDDVGEFLWPVFARENLITHGRRLRLYGVTLWKCAASKIIHHPSAALRASSGTEDTEAWFLWNLVRDLCTWVVNRYPNSAA